MDKIRQLLEKLGSKELADQIVETLNTHESDLKSNLEEEYKARLKKAKEVCIEEVDSYKKELARKVQIFCESRADKIEQQIANQVAIRESAAETKLTQIASLLEGVEVNGDSEAALRAAQDELKAYNKQIAAIKEERNAAVNKANRATGIAEKALERNKALELQVDEGKSESAGKKEAEVVTEGKEGEKEKSKEAKPGTPISTRKTVVENIKKPKEKAEESPVQTMSGFSPEVIASQMD